MDDEIIHWTRGVTRMAKVSEVLDLEKARFELAVLLTTNIRPRHWRPPNPTAMDTFIKYAATSILQAHPILASEKVQGLFPLSHFLLAIAAPNQVIDVCKLYPQALAYIISFEGQDDLPLHIACKRGYNRLVVEEMVQGCPVAVKVYNSDYELPVHCAMRPWGAGGTAIEAVKFLVETYPSCVMEKGPSFTGDDQKYDLLQLAFIHGLDLDLMELIIEHYSTDETCFHVRRGVIGIYEAKGLALLFPKLSTFLCNPSGYTNEGFLFLMRSLQENTSIEKIGLRLPQWPSSPERVGLLLHAVKQFLSHNDAVREIRLSLHQSDQNRGNAWFIGDEWMWAIGTGLRATKRVHSLELSGFVVSERRLLTFLSNGSAPRALVIDQFRVEQKKDLALEGAWGSCQVISLMIRMMPTVENESDYFATHLSVLVNKMKTLRNLGLTSSSAGSRGINMTDHIAAILKNEQIVMLLAVGPSLDCDPICEALKANETLTTCHVRGVFGDEKKMTRLLDVLEKNTTLTLLKDDDVVDPKDETQIDYWTYLNLLGREYLRLPEASVDKLVDMLSTAAEARTSPVDKVNAHFGLLRESPNVWYNAYKN